MQEHLFVASAFEVQNGFSTLGEGYPCIKCLWIDSLSDVLNDPMILEQQLEL